MFASHITYILFFALSINAGEEEEETNANTNAADASQGEASGGGGEERDNRLSLRERVLTHWSQTGDDLKARVTSIVDMALIFLDSNPGIDLHTKHTFVNGEDLTMEEREIIRQIIIGDFLVDTPGVRGLIADEWNSLEERIKQVYIDLSELIVAEKSHLYVFALRALLHFLTTSTTTIEDANNMDTDHDMPSLEVFDSEMSMERIAMLAAAISLCTNGYLSVPFVLDWIEYDSSTDPEHRNADWFLAHLETDPQTLYVRSKFARISFG